MASRLHYHFDRNMINMINLVISSKLQRLLIIFFLFFSSKACLREMLIPLCFLAEMVTQYRGCIKCLTELGIILPLCCVHWSDQLGSSLKCTVVLWWDIHFCSPLFFFLVHQSRNLFCHAFFGSWQNIYSFSEKLSSLTSRSSHLCSVRS